MSRYELIAVKTPRIIAGIFLLAGIGVNFANVIGRYFFSMPIFWAEEAMIYCSLWAVFLGVISVTASGAHLSMDLFSATLPKPVKRVLDVITAIMTALIMGFVSWHSWVTISNLWRFDMRSISLEIPMVVPHMAVFVGFGLSALVVIIRLARNIK